jgi:hypothetical protein
MSHSEKIQRMFDDLSHRGIGAWTFAPPLYRLLWKLGSEIPPPHFSRFSFLLLFQGGFFGLFMGMLVGLVFWPWLSLPLWALLLVIVFAGVFFGLCIASYYRWQARSHGLPLWDEYGCG